MIGWPSTARMRSLNSRAIVSGGPPAVVGAMMVIGRDGNVCACAAVMLATMKADATITCVLMSRSLHCQRDHSS
jgi:hypothetical protein